MKNVIQIHNQHGEKINEIFGKIARFFSGSDKPQLVNSLSYYLENKDLYFDKDGKISSKLPINIQKHIQYLTNLENYRDTKLNKCKDEKGNSVSPKIKIEVRPNYIKIDNSKIIEDYSELYIENLVRGRGMNTFRKIQITDLRCYDLEEDLYGIAWLLDPDSTYFAEKISGKLYADKYNQTVNFWGDWQRGKFYGNLQGKNKSIPKNINKSNLLSQYDLLNKLISQTKNNFQSKFGNTNFDELTSVINNSSNEKVKKFYPEFLKIKKYLDTINVKKGMGTGSSNISYVKSDELSKLKSKIDQNVDLEETLDELKEFYNYINKINAKIDTFYNSLKSIRTGRPSVAAPMRIV